MRHGKVLLLVVLGILAGCVTEIRKPNGELVEEKGPSCGPTPVEQVEAQVRQRIDHMKYEKGTELLSSIETIASCKEIALKPINEALKTEQPPIRANLVYTLGIMGGSQAHAIVARQISDRSPVVRYEVAAALLGFKDPSGVPILIGFLEDEDRRIRFKSFQALQAFAKEDFGYDFGAPEDSRAAAVARWKKWWEAKRSEIVYE